SSDPSNGTSIARLISCCIGCLLVSLRESWSRPGPAASVENPVSPGGSESGFSRTRRPGRAPSLTVRETGGREMSDRDERLWARCHADGMRLFRAGHDAEAERALHQAIHHAEAGRVDGARLACTLFQLAELAQVGHRWAEAERLYQ